MVVDVLGFLNYRQTELSCNLPGKKIARGHTNRNGRYNRNGCIRLPTIHVPLCPTSFTSRNKSEIIQTGLDDHVVCPKPASAVDLNQTKFGQETFGFWTREIHRQTSLRNSVPDTTETYRSHTVRDTQRDGGDGLRMYLKLSGGRPRDLEDDERNGIYRARSVFLSRVLSRDPVRAYLSKQRVFRCRARRVVIITTLCTVHGRPSYTRTTETRR